MFLDTKNGCVFSVKVKTERPKTKVAEVSDNFVVIEIKSKPIENKANEELVSFLKKILNTEVEIVSGRKNKLKKVFVLNLSSKDCAKALMEALNN